MGYFQCSDLLFQFVLVDVFMICDVYYCVMQVGINLNWVFLWIGYNDVYVCVGGLVIVNLYDNFFEQGGYLVLYCWISYVECLYRVGVFWQIYQDMVDNFIDNLLVGFEVFCQVYCVVLGYDLQLCVCGVSMWGLVQLCQDVIDGCLLQVSFIIVDVVGSEYFGFFSLVQGVVYIVCVLDVLIVDLEVWSCIVLLLMFDENDGFFDYMLLFVLFLLVDGGWVGVFLVSIEGEYYCYLVLGDEKYDFVELCGCLYGLGLCVFLYVILLWSCGGWVDLQVYDYILVIWLIECCFGVFILDILLWCCVVCGDFSNVFDFVQCDICLFVCGLFDVSVVVVCVVVLLGCIVFMLLEGLKLVKQESGVCLVCVLFY